VRGELLTGTILVAATLVISACGSEADSVASPNPAQAQVVDPRPSQIAAIADRCGLPHSSLRLNGDQLTFQPPQDARFESVDCMLREVRSAGLDLSTAIGFVGNEYYSRGENVQAR
jgi:hypothetical protein